MHNEKWVDRVFFLQLEHLCKYAFLSIDIIDQNIHSEDNTVIWLEIQNLLASIANISKVLRPPNKMYVERGKRLRSKLDINDDNCLINRDCRNYFEHFDEKIEEWATNSKNKNYVDNTITVNADGSFNEYGDCVFRVFAYDKWKISFGNQSYDMQPVIKELKALYSKLIKLLNT